MSATAAHATAYGKLHLKTAFKNASTIHSIYTGGKAIVSRDERYLFSPFADDINILDLQTGKTTRSLKGEADAISCLALRPNGVHLVSASQSLLLKLWDVLSGDEVRSWKAHEAPVIAMDFDSTSTLLATGSADSTIKVWDVDAGYCTHNFKGHSGIVSAVRFHPDPKHLKLVSGSDDCKIRIWDLHKRACVAVYDSHVSVIRSLDFTPDGRYLLSGARDKVINLWDMHSNSLEKTIPIFESVESVGVLLPGTPLPQSDGITESRLLAYTAGDKGVLKIWDLITGECVAKQQAEPSSKHIIVETIYLRHSHVIVALTSDQNLLFYDIAAGLGRIRQIAGYNQEVLDLTLLGPDDSRLAVITNTEQIRVYDLETMDCDILYGHNEIVMCVDRSNDGTLLASGARDHTAIVWHFQPDASPQNCYQHLATCTGHTEPVSAVAFPKKSMTFLITGSHDRTIKVWDIPEIGQGDFPHSEPIKLKTRYTFQAHEKDIQSIAIAPNDKVFASGALDKTAKLWSVADGTLIGVFKGHRRGIWSVAFSPVDQILATSSTDKTIKLWNVIDFSCVKTFEGHLNSVLQVSFLSSGMQLASSGSDGLVKIWTIRSNECVATLDGHEDRIWALTVHKDERFIISGSSDSKIVIWEDVTVEEDEKKQKEHEEQVLLEQDLSNFLLKRDYKNAILLAMRLDKPLRLLSLFQEVMDARKDFDSILGSLQVDQIITELSDVNLQKLLLHLRTWNTNTRHARTAQAILHVILKSYSPERLLALPKAKEIIDGLLAYTERHHKIADGRVIGSFIVDYTVERMIGFREDVDDDDEYEYGGNEGQGVTVFMDREDGESDDGDVPRMNGREVDAWQDDDSDTETLDQKRVAR